MNFKHLKLKQFMPVLWPEATTVKPLNWKKKATQACYQNCNLNDSALFNSDGNSNFQLKEYTRKENCKDSKKAPICVVLIYIPHR